DRVARRNSQARQRWPYQRGIRAGEKEVDRATRDRESEQRCVWLSLRAGRALRAWLQLLQATRTRCGCSNARRHQTRGCEIFSGSTVCFSDGATARRLRSRETEVNHG